METQDTALFQKVQNAVSGGLSESNAIQFLALLSVSEYERLIHIFKNEETGISEHTRRKLVIILEKLCTAKRAPSV